MIKIFNGNWRGIGENGKGLGLLLDFNFRNIILHFKGANLHVFLSICLHSDQDGFCFPSYDTIERETGYKRATVSKAINELCQTMVGNQHVLMRWRERDEQGRFTGSNRYRIFPTLAEILEVYPEFTFSNSGKNPTLENTNSGQSELEDKPVLKDKPRGKKPPPISSTLSPSTKPALNGKQAKMTGDKYLDAAASKFNRQQNGQVVYGREAKQLAWNAEVPATERTPIATALATLTGKQPLWDAGDERVHDDLHNTAITVYKMGYTEPDKILSLQTKWKADWRGKNGASWTQLLDFLSEQKTQPATSGKGKAKRVARAKGDM